MTTIPFSFGKEVSKMSIENNNFTIKDNSSDISPHLPQYIREPLTILARIRGYKGIDDYVVSMVQDDLVSIKDGAQGVTDIGQDIIKYLERLGITSSTSEPEQEDEEELK
jgi:hypothetical protein